MAYGLPRRGDKTERMIAIANAQAAAGKRVAWCTPTEASAAVLRDRGLDPSIPIHVTFRDEDDGQA